MESLRIISAASFMDSTLEGSTLLRQRLSARRTTSGCLRARCPQSLAVVPGARRTRSGHVRQ